MTASEKAGYRDKSQRRSISSYINPLYHRKLVSSQTQSPLVYNAFVHRFQGQQGGPTRQVDHDQAR